MPSRTSSFLSDKLTHAAGLLFAATMVTNVFGYAFQLAMGRLLPPAEFGLLNALLAFFAALSVPVLTLFMVIARRTSQHKAAGELGAIAVLYGEANRKILTAGAAALGLFIASSPWLQSYVKAPGILPVLLLGLAAFISLAAPINNAVLQGLQDYRWLAAASAAAGPLKFGVCVAFALAGLGVSGVLSGIMIANIALWTLTFIPLRRHFRAARTPAGSLSFREVFPVFGANLGFVLLTQSDMALVARHFTPEVTGVYAYAAILAKAVMYIPGAIALAMFPMASEERALNKQGGLLLKSMAMTFCLSGAAALFLGLFPEAVLSVTFGPRAAGASELLRCLSAAMLPMALLMVMMNYLVARGETWLAYSMIFGAGAQFAAIQLFHRTPFDIAYIIGASGLAQVAALYALERSARTNELNHDQRILVQNRDLSGVGR